MLLLQVPVVCPESACSPCHNNQSPFEVITVVWSGKVSHRSNMTNHLYYFFLQIPQETAGSSIMAGRHLKPWLLSWIEDRAVSPGSYGIPQRCSRWHPVVFSQGWECWTLTSEAKARKYEWRIKDTGKRKMLRETYKDSKGVGKKAKEGERAIKAAEQEIGSSRFSQHKKTPTHSHLSLHLKASKEKGDWEISTPSSNCLFFLLFYLFLILSAPSCISATVTYTY